VLPAGRAPRGLAIYVNGALSDPADQYDKLQLLANATGKAMVGVHNHAHGVTGLFRMAAGRLGLPVCGAVKTVKDVIRGELLAGREVHLFGHSHGALITAEAIAELKKELDLPDAEVEQLLRRCEVETWGGAAAVFPTGPVYRHITNDLDPIVRFYGLGTGVLRPRGGRWENLGTSGAIRVAAELVGDPGRDSSHDRFTELPAPSLASFWESPMPSHSFRLYLRRHLARSAERRSS
jgi:hypothetical protein